MNSSNMIYSSIPSVLDSVHPYAQSALIILFIAFILMAASFILSNIFLFCVVTTKERKFKYLSNASWFSSAFSLIMIFTATLALSFGGSVL